jgi:hypothetical protein
MMEYVQNFFNLMDLPGSSVRDVLAGENPFDQWSSPLSGKNRVSGSQLVSKYTGSDPDSWGTFIAGLGTEILTDPVNLVGGGSLIRNLVHAKQFNNAARAANAAEAGKYSFMNRAASSPLIPEATPASEQVLKLGYSPLVPPLKSEAAEVISRRGIDDLGSVPEVAGQLRKYGVNPTEIEEVAGDAYGRLAEGKASPLGQVAKERVESLKVHKFDDQTERRTLTSRDLLDGVDPTSETGAIGGSKYDNYSLKKSGKFGDGKYEEYLFTHPTATSWAHWTHARIPASVVDRGSKGVVGHVRAMWNGKEAVIGELQSDYHQMVQKIGYRGNKFVKKPRSVVEDSYFKGKIPTKEMMDRVYEIHDREDFAPGFGYFGGGQIDKAEYEKLLSDPASGWKVRKETKKYEVTHELDGNPDIVIAKDIDNSSFGKFGQQRFVVMNRQKDGTLAFDAMSMFPEEVDLKFADGKARIFSNSLILPPEKKTPLSLEGITKEQTEEMVDEYARIMTRNLPNRQMGSNKEYENMMLKTMLRRFVDDGAETISLAKGEEIVKSISNPGNKGAISYYENQVKPKLAALAKKLGGKVNKDPGDGARTLSVTVTPQMKKNLQYASQPAYGTGVARPQQFRAAIPPQRVEKRIAAAAAEASSPLVQTRTYADRQLRQLLDRKRALAMAAHNYAARGHSYDE